MMLMMVQQREEKMMVMIVKVPTGLLRVAFCSSSLFRFGQMRLLSVQIELGAKSTLPNSQRKMGQ